MPPYKELVDLIVERTLKPLAEERLQAFADKAAALKSERRSKQERREELEQLDPAEAVLELKVLDPAMGSGHFLVTAVDFLSDYIAELIERVPSVPEWLDGEYASPLVGRVAAIRGDTYGSSGEWLSLRLEEPAWKASGELESDGCDAQHPPRFDPRQIQRYVLQRVVELGWTRERFGQFDRSWDVNNVGLARAERIGEKYQLIVTNPEDGTHMFFPPKALMASSNTLLSIRPESTGDIFPKIMPVNLIDGGVSKRRKGQH